MIRFLILAGYFEISMYLYLTGKLEHYINTHYTYLAFIAMGLSLVLAIVQLVIWMKQLNLHSHLSEKWAKLFSPMLLVLPIVVALFIPTVSLDASTVSAKGYTFPLAAGADPEAAAEEGGTVQYLRPDTSLYFTSAAYDKEMQQALSKYKDLSHVTITTENYMEVMELIYLYPDAFTGKQITYTGFVYNEPGHEGYQFLFRFGIIHCIADSGVYGLLTTGTEQSFEDNTWLTVTGHIELQYDQNLEQTLPTLHITDTTETKQPDNPYVYRVF